MFAHLTLAPLLAALVTVAGPAAPQPELIAVPAAVPASSSSAAGLRAQVDAALAGSTARIVSAAVDVDGLGVVERRNAAASVPPASTEKLFTVETALKQLGPTYRYRTSLRSSGTRVGALLRGDLYLVAGGDPFLTSTQLDALAKSFAASGITTISGHLVVDDTRYDRVRHGYGWKPEWVPEESGPLSAMALDGNTWRQDSSYLADPATPVLAKLRTYLAKRGVRLTTSDARRGPALSSATSYASIASAPLSAVATRILKESDNFGAELVLKELGKAVRGAGTSSAGAQVVQTTTGAGDAVHDGSGLSPYDRQTTGRELALLSTSLSDLKTKLPVGCRDGTLEKRFCGTVASGRVYAKTGTLDTAHALAGWTYTRDGHLVTFSFILASFTSGSAATKAIDRAVVVLAGATVS
jgi:D-alanyl-D-alanine carboxypeptidase/D-alanyl-D-alanine-endopeptidase (penicillin-binding protein 4)